MHTGLLQATTGHVHMTHVPENTSECCERSTTLRFNANNTRIQIHKRNLHRGNPWGGGGPACDTRSLRSMQDSVIRK